VVPSRKGNKKKETQNGLSVHWKKTQVRQRIAGEVKKGGTSDYKRVQIKEANVKIGKKEKDERGNAY